VSTKEFAGKLVKEIVATKSYSLWKDSTFRRLIGFSQISNKQQDKIFNELQVTALLHILFFLEEKSGGDKEQAVYANIAEYIESAFLDLMSDVRVSDAHLKLWKGLIAKRKTEYRQDMKFVEKESAEWEVFSGEDRLLRGTWVRVITLSVGAAKLVGGSRETLVDDPLWKEIRRWLISIEVELVNIFRDTDFRELKVLN